MRSVVRLTCFLVGMLWLWPGMTSASFLDRFIDPKDGQFDASAWLIDHHGPMFMPIIITEPALGYGGGAALLFFHRSEQKHPLDEGRTPGEGRSRYIPPSVSTVFGFATETSSWAAGAQHLGIWRQDAIRTLTLAAYTSVNLKFYPNDEAMEVNLAGYVINQEVEFRIGDSNLLLGGRYRYSSLDTTPTSGNSLLPDLPDDAIGGLGLLVHWDSRDNMFTPNRGQDFMLGADFNTPAFGGDTTWWALDYALHSYHTLHPRLVLGLRFDGQSTWGEVPFYALPFVDMRGIPAMRYQGEQAGEGEFELRWRAYKRFSLIGFFGLGWTAGSFSGESGPFPAGGVGFRYLIARRLGMQMGIDVARGPEETAFYIQLGSSW